MAQWRKLQFPKCPKCHSSSSHSSHRNCPGNGRLWVDILSGTVVCDGNCGAVWSLEQGTNYCDCGAYFEGGSLWTGMASELVHLRGLGWVQRVGIAAKGKKTRYLGQWKKKGLFGKLCQMFS